MSNIKGGGDFTLERRTYKYIHYTKVDTLGQSNGESSDRMSALLRCWLTSRKEVSLAQTPNTVTLNVVLPKPLGTQLKFLQRWCSKTTGQMMSLECWGRE